MSLTTMLARCVSAMLLLFACAGALAANDAVFVSQSVPTSMAPGGAYNVAVTMKNTGSTTWPPGTAYLLGSQNPPDNTRWGGARAALSGPVAPGGQATFSFQVTAPATPGTYGFQWRMVQEYVEWFGALTPNVAVSVAPPQRNDAQVISQTAPSQMTSGKSYTASVTLKNIGTTTWKSADGYTLGAQNPQDNRLWNGGRVTLGATVAPGQQYTFSFPVTAPAPGSYSMQWKMLRENVEWFGGTSSSPVNVAAAPGSDVITYIHTDALGSPVARTDVAGNVVSRTNYEPYGATAGGVTPTIGFTGHVNDADTGLVYMQQRYYDPVAARFLSIDPVTTDAKTGVGFNRYAYSNNSPYRYIDPDGRNPIALAIVGGGAVLLIGAWKYAIDPKARAVINRIVAAAVSSGGGNQSSPAVGQGCIYCVPGDKTSSGKDYIGSTDDLDKRSKDLSDGRDRKGAEVVDTYPIGEREERRRKEQQAINDKGGVSETDNKRNEIRETKWGEKGVEPPPKVPEPKSPEPARN